MKRADRIDKAARWVIWFLCLFAVLYFGAHVLAQAIYRAYC